MRALLAAGLVLSACAPASDEPAARDGAARVPARVPAGVAASVPAVAVSSGGAVLTSAVVRDGSAARRIVTHADGREATVARGAIADGSQAAPRLVAAPNGTVLALYATETAVAGRRRSRAGRNRRRLGPRRRRRRSRAAAREPAGPLNGLAA